jgi:hypothetical protein
MMTLVRVASSFWCAIVALADLALCSGHQTVADEQNATLALIDVRIFPISLFNAGCP